MITKDDLLREFDEAWADPAAEHGEVFDDLARRLVRRFLPISRTTVVEVFRGWIGEGRTPTAMLAARLAAEFRLTELLPDIEEMDRRIAAGQILLPYARERTQKAITSLRSATADSKR